MISHKKVCELKSPCALAREACLVPGFSPERLVGLAQWSKIDMEFVLLVSPPSLTDTAQNLCFKFSTSLRSTKNLYDIQTFSILHILLRRLGSI
jgi:hypothetical protein